MRTRRRRPRKRSWASAAVTVVGALFSVVVSVVVGVEGLKIWHQGAGAADAPVCVLSGPDEGCLQRVGGAADRVRSSRQLGWTWAFDPFPGSSADRESGVAVSRGVNQQLERTASVDGLYWRGRLVAFYDAAEDRVIETQELGATAWAGRLYTAGLGLVGAYGAWLVARHKHSLAGWWARPPVVAPEDLLPASHAWLGVAMFALMGGFFAIVFGASAAASVWALIVSGLALGLCVVLGRWRTIIARLQR